MDNGCLVFVAIAGSLSEDPTKTRKYIEANDVGEQNIKTPKTMEMIELIIAIFIV